MMNGNGLEVPYNRVNPQNFIYNGMNFTYTGSGTHISPFNVGEELTRVLHKECYNGILQLRSSLCNTVQNVRQSGL